MLRLSYIKYLCLWIYDIENICIILVVNLFIMYLFYLSRHISLIGYIFVIYCYWPKFTPVTCDLLNFGKIVVSRVHFLLTETIKRNNQGIIQNINVIVKRWSFCGISTIYSVCVFGAKEGFIPVFKPHTLKLYILRQCTNIVYDSLSGNVPRQLWHEQWIFK